MVMLNDKNIYFTALPPSFSLKKSGVGAASLALRLLTCNLKKKVKYKK